MSPAEVTLLYIMRIFFGIAGIALTIGFIDAVVRLAIFFSKRSKPMVVMMILGMLALAGGGMSLWLSMR